MPGRIAEAKTAAAADSSAAVFDGIEFLRMTGSVMWWSPETRNSNATVTARSSWESTMEDDAADRQGAQLAVRSEDGCDL